MSATGVINFPNQINLLGEKKRKVVHRGEFLEILTQV